eukprot:TRINITY_DN60616_c0_g1_i1.p3 TRINITY_DN60616_c0_g1~~TRINITY_DN60616_c0_g1_i1.p3  ORF type:complete len:103 (-),score=11.23 TRINITY_DN60616_c0_g1_i1:59-367(-)
MNMSTMFRGSARLFLGGGSDLRRKELLQVMNASKIEAHTVSNAFFSWFEEQKYELSKCADALTLRVKRFIATHRTSPKRVPAARKNVGCFSSCLSSSLPQLL